MNQDADDVRFLLEDTILEDLLGDLCDVGDENTICCPSNGGAAALYLPESSSNSGIDSLKNHAFLTVEAPPVAAPSPPRPANNQSPPTNKKPMVNSTRQRMKEELAYLRSKVIELERHLERVTKSSTTISHDSHSHNNCENSVLLVNMQQRSLWERVATHQRVEKQKAERLNRELRMLLEDQLRVARSLEKALKKRPSAMLSNHHSLLDELANGTKKRLCTLGNPQDASTFSLLLPRVEAAYQELASVWQRTGLDTHKGERSDTQVIVDDDTNKLFLEVINTKIVPFSLAATSDAAWSCLSRPTLKFLNGIYRTVHATPNSIHSNSEMWIRIGDDEAQMNMAIVTQRFVEEKSNSNNRVVFVLEASTVSGGTRNVLHSLRLVERGWVVFEPVGPSTGDGGRDTLIQVCMRLTPAVTEETDTHSSNTGVTPDRMATGAYTNLILAAFHQNLGILYQSIENLLVEQMVPKNSVTSVVTQ